MKTKRTRNSYVKVTIALLISALSTFANNNLAVVRTTTNILEVQLTNSEEISGVQFSLHASSDIVLGGLARGLRTEDSHWTVASYKPNDSTINVVILNMECKSFSHGQGTLACIPFSTVNSVEMSYVSLANVMITNPAAESLGVTINNLEWSNNSTIASNSDKTNSFVLNQNFPNPFNPSTKIVYRLNKAAQVRLSVYDITGREVSRLIDQYQYVGEYNMEWDCNNNGGQKLASGMYFARLTVDNESMSRKMVLMK